MDAFNAGMFAAETQKPRSSNPYPCSDPNHQEWNSGYDYAIDTQQED
jgi:hypothetical protein